MAYATVDEFEAFLEGDPLPAHPRRLLDRASEVIDELLVGAVYDVADGLPTDVNVAGKLRKATLLQAQHMTEAGFGSESTAQFASMTTGGVSWTRATRADGSTEPDRYSPAVLTYLRSSGLLASVGIWSW